MNKLSGLFCVLALALPASVALAGDDAVARTLKELDGKRATVVLASGTELTGKVANPTADSVKLVELSNKDFFDAVVDLDHVQAVVYRARGE